MKIGQYTFSIYGMNYCDTSSTNRNNIIPQIGCELEKIFTPIKKFKIISYDNFFG
jgi:hypothetical protein